MKRVPPWLHMLLWPVSLLYGLLVRTRVWLYGKGWLKQNRLRAAVISVGNLTVGGTGKTPMVIWLAEKFLAEGKRVAILSRGYRGTNGTSDEIELMKFRLQGRVSFGVGKNRFAEGHRLESQQPIDIFLLDDGFQHLQLARDVNILLLDVSQPMGKEFLLPAGRFREPLSAMGRANLVVFTRTETMPGTAEAIAKLQKYPVFSAGTRLLGFRRFGGEITIFSPAEIGPGPFLAFCGLGNPGAFFRDLASWVSNVMGHLTFPDHHRYTERDVRRIREAARQIGALALITTEKDAQNLGGFEFGETPLFVSVIDLVVSPAADFMSALCQILAPRSGAAT